jgi:hypothetical protein
MTKIFFKIIALGLLTAIISACSGLARLGAADGSKDATKEEIDRLPKECSLVNELRIAGKITLYAGRSLELPIKQNAIQRIIYLCADETEEIKRNKQIQDAIAEQRLWLSPLASPAQLAAPSLSPSLNISR